MEDIKIKAMELSISIVKLLNNQYTPYIVIISQAYVR